MAYAESNRASIRYIEETSWGVTPATGASREVRLTSSSLSATKETVVSDELRADRMVSSVSEVSASSGGDINFEFSAGAQDEFLAAFLMGAWSRPMTADFVRGIVSVGTTSTFVVTGRDVTEFFKAGRRIQVKGFANPANNGYFEITSSAFAGGNTTITVPGTALVAQAGGVNTAIYDANDVIVLNTTTIASTATGFSSTGTPFTSAIAAGQLRIGQRIYVDGLAGVSGVYRITAVTNNTITTAPAPTSVVAAGAAVSIKGSMLRNPSNVSTIAQRMFTLETAYNDVGQFQIQDGMVPGSFSLEIASGSIITGTMQFQGRETRMLSTTTLGGGVYKVLPAQTGEVVNATSNVGAVEKDGAAYATAIQSISINGATDLRQRGAIGSKFSRGIGSGRFNLTGSMVVYFEDAALFNEFLNHTTISLSFRIKDQDGYTYVFTIPAIKITQDQVAPGGIDQDILHNVEFSALRDNTTECMMQVDRFSPSTL